MGLITKFPSFCLTRILLPKLLYIIVPLHHPKYLSRLVGVKMNLGSFLHCWVVAVIELKMRGHNNHTRIQWMVQEWLIFLFRFFVVCPWPKAGEPGTKPSATP